MPGSDLLHGVCHCGAETTGDEPTALWDWLLGHPDHPADGPRGTDPRGGPPEPPAHVVTRPVRVRHRTPQPA